LVSHLQNARRLGRIAAAFPADRALDVSARSSRCAGGRARATENHELTAAVAAQRCSGACAPPRKPTPRTAAPVGRSARVFLRARTRCPCVLLTATILRRSPQPDPSRGGPSCAESGPIGPRLGSAAARARRLRIEGVDQLMPVPRRGEAAVDGPFDPSVVCGAHRTVSAQRPTERTRRAAARQRCVASDAVARPTKGRGMSCRCGTRQQAGGSGRGIGSSTAAAIMVAEDSRGRALARNFLQTRIADAAAAPALQVDARPRLLARVELAGCRAALAGPLGPTRPRACALRGQAIRRRRAAVLLITVAGSHENGLASGHRAPSPAKTCRVAFAIHTLMPLA
jgi:hypothetical protein